MIAPVCRSCGRDIDRHENEALPHWQARSLCSQKTCTGQGLIPRPVYPYAHVQGWADVPPVCPVDGGPWKLVETGVVCRTCAAERIVAAAIRAAEHGQPVSRV